MNRPPFKALWTYRYHKYTHIVGKYVSFAFKYLKLRLLKLRLGNRPLVAIILSEQMGDIIACEPIAREVRKRHPDGYLLWVVRKPYVDLVQYNPVLDGYLVEKCPGERISLLDSGVYDYVYNLHISHRRCKYCKTDPINPTADAIGLNFDNYYDRGDLLYIFSQGAGLPPITADPRMHIPAHIQKQVADRNLPANPIVLHCQSTHVMRDWPAANWNRLVNWLLETYPNPIIEVGLSPVVTVQNPRVINLCGQLSLLETAEIIRTAQLFIGIDSGPAHMANAMHTDGVILMGQLFDFVDYLPYSGRYKRGEGVTILNDFGRSCSELPYDWVQRAIEQRLGELKLA